MNKRNTTHAPLSPADIARLKAFTTEHTDRVALGILGISSRTLYRAKAGKPIARKTAAGILEPLAYRGITPDEAEIAAEEAALNTRRALARIMEPERAKRIANQIKHTVKRLALGVPVGGDPAGHDGPPAPHKS